MAFLLGREQAIGWARADSIITCVAETLSRGKEVDYDSIVPFLEGHTLLVRHLINIFNIETSVARCVLTLLLGVDKKEAAKMYEWGRKFNTFLIVAEEGMNAKKRQFCRVQVNAWLNLNATSMSYRQRPKRTYNCACCTTPTPTPTAYTPPDSSHTTSSSSSSSALAGSGGMDCPAAEWDIPFQDDAFEYDETQFERTLAPLPLDGVGGFGSDYSPLGLFDVLGALAGSGGSGDGGGGGSTNTPIPVRRGRQHGANQEIAKQTPLSPHSKVTWEKKQLERKTRQLTYQLKNKNSAMKHVEQQKAKLIDKLCENKGRLQKQQQKTKSEIKKRKAAEAQMGNKKKGGARLTRSGGDGLAQQLAEVQRARLKEAAKFEAAQLKEMERTEKQRELKRKAHARARDAEKEAVKTKEHNKKLKTANQRLRSGEYWEKEKDKDLPEVLRRKLEMKDEDIRKVEEEWAKKVMGRVEKERADCSEFFAALGNSKEQYGLEAVELGMELMQLRLSAPQAANVLRRTLRKIFPKLEEGKDYRVPGTAMLKVWRDCLKPICEFISVDALSKCDKFHILHDASTKKGVSVLQVTARGEFPGGHVQTMPMKFVVVVNGDSSTETDAVLSALHSDLAHKPSVRMRDAAVGATSDDANGAVKVSTLLELENQIQAMVPRTKSQHEKWMDMTPEQREVAGIFFGRTCTGDL